jgi:eukaryotic-like serine/threonine-protein kinase
LKDELQAALASQYTIESEIGRGGMATVFLAQDRKHSRAVALKVLHAELAESLGPERFRREIAFAAQLQHPHVLTVLDSGETPNGLLWFTMPFVEGESLRARLRRERQLAVDEAIRITREVAQAVDYAHRHKVIHRDIKPENILLTTDGQALVADFGIARALTGHTDEHTLTGTGMSVGTPGYMSPEQASGDRHLDARSDVYALGAVCYEMLVGEPPFTGPTSQAILAKVLSGEAPSLRRSRPAAPPALDAAVQKALSPVPADRFATAMEFARALEAAERSAATVSATAASRASPPAGSIAARDPGPRREAGRRLPTGVALLGLGFLIGIGALFAWRSRSASSAGASGPIRVAVLPFDNLGDTSEAYFSDGLTDAVRGKLTTVPGLAVIAAASSVQYRHTTKSPQQIADELGGVRYLLVGKVRWAKLAGTDSRVQVSPELIDVTTGTDAWQQPFDAPVKDVFAVQGDIAGRVVQALGVALNAGERQTFAERPTTNLDAYDVYLKGEAARSGNGNSIAALDEAADRYQEAIALDSGFAAAWARLALVEASAYFNGSTTPKRAALAKLATERAGTLAPGRPDTYLAQGAYDAFVQNDNRRALGELEAGLKLAPSNALLAAYAALAEQTLGRWDSALVHLRQAQSLDPRAPVTARRLVTTYLWLRRYPEATAASERALVSGAVTPSAVEVRAMVELGKGDLPAARAVIRRFVPAIDSSALVIQFGNFWDLYWVLDDAQQRYLLAQSEASFGGPTGWATTLAETFALRGDKVRARIYADSARLALEKVLKAAPEDGQSHALLGLMYAYLGRKADAIREVERATTGTPIAQDGYSGPYYVDIAARTYILIGEYDRALDALEQILKVPYWVSPGVLRINPEYAPLRSNPRFQKLAAGG